MGKQLKHRGEIYVIQSSINRTEKRDGSID